MLKFLVLWAILDIIIWLGIIGPYVFSIGWFSIQRSRTIVAFCVQIWVYVLPWVIGVWVLLFRPGIRILGLALLCVWYAQWWGLQWVACTPVGRVSGDRQFFTFLVLEVYAVFTLYLLFVVYQSLTL